ncbi:transglutaminase domain-containing protein [Tenacibaculum sp. IB213877]|uniref:transglutaminase domain-containing protein n=1 Tax=Tenacibaculum sp. IB213877 TaxID=3097351 RepID=UPI002A5AC1AE|nr:transglutaminase domain-containing protein [Tenacibaculum sp. IB213877]MDY0780112.1 transglutaminase domain-containing protein [Tenacibaculum sp. IB213877]
MKQLLFFFVLLISLSIASQDFSKIKDVTDTYPGLLTAQKLAEKINTDFSSDEDKVKAIYSWMTKNIRYDLEEFYNPTRKEIRFSYQTEAEKEQKLLEFKNKIVSETLSTRKAVCEGFAQTFSKVCDLLNIENEVIPGYVRTTSYHIGKPLPQPNHAWNAVKLDNNWIYIDATWGAGTENNGKWYRKFNSYYFNIPKNKYFKTHFPDESIWVLRVGRMEKNDFYNQPIFMHEFLKSDVELISPTSGTLSKNKEGKIALMLKNLKPHQSVHVGFLGSPYAERIPIEKVGDNSLLEITPPQNSKHLFLLIDKEVAIQFLIE